MCFPLIVDIPIIAYGKSSTWDERLTNKNIRIMHIYVYIYICIIRICKIYVLCASRHKAIMVIAADRHWFLIISVYLISINFSTEKNLNNLRKF